MYRERCMYIYIYTHTYIHMYTHRYEICTYPAQTISASRGPRVAVQGPVDANLREFTKGGLVKGGLAIIKQ